MIDRDQLREALALIETDAEVGDLRGSLASRVPAYALIFEAARLVADPDTLTITKVDGQWPVPIMESINGWRDGYASVPELLDVLLEGQPK